MAYKIMISRRNEYRYASFLQSKTKGVEAFLSPGTIKKVTGKEDQIAVFCLAQCSDFFGDFQQLWRKNAVCSGERPPKGESRCRSAL